MLIGSVYSLGTRRNHYNDQRYMMSRHELMSSPPMSISQLSWILDQHGKLARSLPCKNDLSKRLEFELILIASLRGLLDLSRCVALVSLGGLVLRICQYLLGHCPPALALKYVYLIL